MLYVEFSKLDAMLAFFKNKGMGFVRIGPMIKKAADGKEYRLEGVAVMGRKGNLRFVHKKAFKKKIKFAESGAYERYVSEMQWMKESLRAQGFRCGGSAGMVCV